MLEYVTTCECDASPAHVTSFASPARKGWFADVSSHRAAEGGTTASPSLSPNYFPPLPIIIFVALDLIKS